MLTKDQDKSLQQALKDFIKLLFTTEQREVYLYYAPDSKSFIASDGEAPQRTLYLMSGKPFKLRWEDFLTTTYTEEVKAIINDPTKAEYDYPPEIISEVKKLAASGFYNYDNDSNEEILINSGAAAFILNNAIQENILYFTYVDKHYFNFLYHKAIEESALYEWEF